MTENLPAQREPKIQVNLGGPILDLDQLMRAADIFSRSDLLPKALRGNAPNTLLVMLTGQELGLSLTQAFRTIYMPSGGQPQLRGVLVLAKLRQAGHTYRFEETDDSCTFTVIRGDTQEEYTGTFTTEDAITAKLAKRAADGNVVALSDNNKELPWMLYRHDMLQWRAVARGALRGAPEVLLGFEIAGAVPPEPQEDIKLQPQSPAPPEPAGEAAPGSQAAQAAQLRELDERMRGPESPDMGGNPANVVDPDMAEDLEAETTLPAAGAAEAPTAPSASAPPAVDNRLSAEDIDATEPDASAKAKKVVLSEWFTTLGYDPAIYRAEVLRACSVYTRRRIKGTRDLRAAEVMSLTNELSAIFRRDDELAPVTRLAEQVDAWEQKWEHTDPDGYATYIKEIQ